MDNLTLNLDNKEFLALEADIHFCLNRRSRKLTFISKLEAQFQILDRPKRQRRYLWSGICGLFLYILFCINDQVMLPDIYLTAWKIRLGIVSPLLIMGLFALRSERYAHLWEYISGALLLLVNFSILLLISLSSHPNVIHYHTGSLLIVIFGNIIMRMRFKSILIVCLLIFLGHVIIIPICTGMPQPVLINSSVMLFAVILVSLSGNYQIEWELRRAYLLSLLQQINTIKLQRSNCELEQLSHSDGLTGLANRRFFNKAFAREWNAGVRYRTRLTLIFIDIDYFKKYNDSYGHLLGDECLQQIGGLLKKHVRRGSDMIARYGGEEFVILLPGTPLQDAKQLAEQIRQDVEEHHFEHAASEIAGHVTISLGVASLIPDLDTKAEQLIDMADTALYQAKENGRNQVCGQ